MAGDEKAGVALIPHDKLALIRAAARTDPSMRNEFELKILREYMEASPFASQLAYEQQMEMVRIVRHRTYEDGQPVVVQGDSLDDRSQFFFLFTGDVMVFVKDIEARGRPNLSRGDVGMLVATLHASSLDTFGEKAMLEGGTRNATVIAQGATEVLCVAKPDFVRIVTKVEGLLFSPNQVARILQKPGDTRTEADLRLLRGVLKRYNAIRHLSDAVIDDLARAVSYKTYPYQTIVRRQGDDLSNIFSIILRGSASVHMKSSNVSKEETVDQRDGPGGAVSSEGLQGLPFPELEEIADEDVDHDSSSDSDTSDDGSTRSGQSRSSKASWHTSGRGSFRGAAAVAVAVAGTSPSPGRASPRNSPASPAGSAHSIRSIGSRLSRADSGLAGALSSPRITATPRNLSFGNIARGHSVARKLKAKSSSLSRKDSSRTVGASSEASGASPRPGSPASPRLTARSSRRSLVAGSGGGAVKSGLGRLRLAARRVLSIRRPGSMLHFEKLRNEAPKMAEVVSLALKMREKVDIGPKVLSLGPGDSFGEDALEAEVVPTTKERATQAVEGTSLDDDGARSSDEEDAVHEKGAAAIRIELATIAVTSELHVIELTRSAYRRILAQHASDAVAKMSAMHNAALMMPAAERSAQHVGLLVNMAARIPFLSQIPAPVREQLMELCTGEYMKRGDVVYSQHDPLDAVYVLATGKVALRYSSAATERPGPVDVESVLEDPQAVILPGDCFGHEEKLTQFELYALACQHMPRNEDGDVDARAYSAVAMTDDVQLIRIQATDFTTLIVRSGLHSMCTYSPAAAHAVLGKASDDRSLLELAIAGNFLSQVPFFQQVPQTVISRVVRWIWSETKQPEEPIIEEGETGTLFYVIASGKVAIHKYGAPATDDLRRLPPQRVTSIEKYGPVVATLSKGDTVGAVAVESGSQRRNASVVALRPCTILVMSGEEYVRCIMPLGDKLCYVPRLAQNVLRVRPEDRTPQQLKHLAVFLQRIDFIKQLKQEKQDMLFKVLRFRKVQAGSVVCKQGAAGKEMYIVNSGTLGVFVRPPEGGEKDEAVTLSTIRSTPHMPSDLGPMVARLGPGDSFGEAALKTAGNTERNASVAAISQCTLMVLAKQDYRTILLDMADKIEFRPRMLHENLKQATSSAGFKVQRVHMTMSLLRNVAGIDAMDVETRTQVCEHAKYYAKKANDVIYDKNEYATFVYIVLQGTVDVIREEHRIARLRSRDVIGNVEVLMGERTHLRVQAREDTRLVAIHRNAYLRYWPLKDQDMEKISFLQELPGMSKLTSAVLITLNYLMMERSYSRGDFLAHQDWRAKAITVVKDGECKVIKRKLAVVPGVDEAGRIVPKRRAEDRRLSVSLAQLRGADDGESSPISPDMDDPDSPGRPLGFGGKRLARNITVLGGTVMPPTPGGAVEATVATPAAGAAPRRSPQATRRHAAKQKKQEHVDRMFRLPPYATRSAEPRARRAKYDSGRVTNVEIAHLGVRAAFGSGLYHDYSVVATSSRVTVYLFDKQLCGPIITPLSHVLAAMRDFVSMSFGWRNRQSRTTTRILKRTRAPPQQPMLNTLGVVQPLPHEKFPPPAKVLHGAVKRARAVSISPAVELGQAFKAIARVEGPAKPSRVIVEPPPRTSRTSAAQSLLLADAAHTLGRAPGDAADSNAAQDAPETDSTAKPPPLVGADVEDGDPEDHNDVWKPLPATLVPAKSPSHGGPAGARPLSAPAARRRPSSRLVVGDEEVSGGAAGVSRADVERTARELGLHASLRKSTPAQRRGNALRTQSDASIMISSVRDKRRNRRPASSKASLIRVEDGRLRPQSFVTSPPLLEGPGSPIIRQRFRPARRPVTALGAVTATAGITAPGFARESLALGTSRIVLRKPDLTMLPESQFDVSSMFLTAARNEEDQALMPVSLTESTLESAMRSYVEATSPARLDQGSVRSQRVATPPATVDAELSIESHTMVPTERPPHPRSPTTRSPTNRSPTAAAAAAQGGGDHGAAEEPSTRSSKIEVEVPSLVIFGDNDDGSAAGGSHSGRGSSAADDFGATEVLSPGESSSGSPTGRALGSPRSPVSRRHKHSESHGSPTANRLRTASAGGSVAESLHSVGSLPEMPAVRGGHTRGPRGGGFQVGVDPRDPMPRWRDNTPSPTSPSNSLVPRKVLSPAERDRQRLLSLGDADNAAATGDADGAGGEAPAPMAGAVDGAAAGRRPHTSNSTPADAQGLDASDPFVATPQSPVSRRRVRSAGPRVAGSGAARPTTADAARAQARPPTAESGATAGGRGAPGRRRRRRRIRRTQNTPAETGTCLWHKAHQRAPLLRMMRSLEASGRSRAEVLTRPRAIAEATHLGVLRGSATAMRPAFISPLGQAEKPPETEDGNSVVDDAVGGRDRDALNERHGARTADHGDGGGLVGPARVARERSTRSMQEKLHKTRSGILRRVLSRSHSSSSVGMRGAYGLQNVAR